MESDTLDLTSRPTYDGGDCITHHHVIDEFLFSSMSTRPKESAAWTVWDSVSKR